MIPPLTWQLSEDCYARHRYSSTLEKVAQNVAYFARQEGLEAHARSAVIRSEESL